MNKAQKEVQKSLLNSEEKVIKDIQTSYEKALKDIKGKIKQLQADELTQSKIYQIEYQKALKSQVETILDGMNSNHYDTIQGYLKDSYYDSYIGTMYDLSKQGIPVTMPIDQNQVVKAVQIDSKLSESMYKKMGKYTGALKKAVTQEITRGVASSLSYADIARNLDKRTSIGIGKTLRIARTEGHRVQQQSTLDAQKAAKESGADVVKQWDSTMDKKTRPHHQQLDGQLREVDEPFEVAGKTAMYPGGFGVASEDIHCRCVLLQRARWALDDEELETMKQRAEYYGLDKTKDFDEFKKKYIEATKPEPFNEYTYTLNNDGFLTKGTVKYQAQYKLDIDNMKVMNLDVSEATKSAKEMADLLGTSVDKWSIISESFKNKMRGEFWTDYLPKFNYDHEAALKVFFKDKGFEGVNILQTNDKLKDVFDNGFMLVDDSKLVKTKKSKFETLSASLATQQKKLNKIDNKTYTGIWKEPVSLSDYKLKKDSIAAKRAWYLEQIAKADKAKIAQYQKYLDDLDEFEKLGADYEKISDKITKIQGDIKKFAPKPSTNVGNAFSQTRKDNAHWFTKANGGTRGADAVLRDKTGEVWQAATEFERKSIYGYTSGSGAWNRPLSGFEKPWNKSGSGWEPEFNKGVGNVWIDFEGKGNEIRSMTDLINRSEYDFDIWLQRGCQDNAIESFLNLPPGTLSGYSHTDLQQFVGVDSRIQSFVSTSVSKGNGFSGSVIMNIYAPNGTKMMYAEPFSAFGNGSGANWDGVKKQTSFGSEAEMILQRGGSYTVTKIEKKNGKIYMDLEAHPEKGYDLFQQDPNEWQGSKEKYK